MPRVLLLRHGQSEWNALGRWQGQADPPLSGLGRLQARHAAPRVPAATHLVSSDLRRAAQTSEIVAEHHGWETVVDPAFRERHAGAWQGLTRAEIEERWPGWLEEHRRPDDYESDESVLARLLPGLARVAERIGADETGVVVCHGGVIFTLERRFGAPFERLANLAGRWVELRDGAPVGLGERVRLVDEDEVTVPGQL